MVKVEEQTIEQLREELRQVREEIVRLKTQALADINELKLKFEEYIDKQKEYELAVEDQNSQREDRASTQFGWGQAVNFIPIFSHAYSYGANKSNELVEKEQKNLRETLSKTTTEQFQEVRKLFNDIKERDCYKQGNNFILTNTF
ncbi:9019_t:CDS:1 [Ambispora leptoticha]|uniref:9019_t:CDS:1 n=1 Tax=Ambispora leptoticha TaxID=144679 RepID=A0A9N9D9J5_9GLOM|nr:9019_t:CDS:1 [Ambispora leptoticha]